MQRFTTFFLFDFECDARDFWNPKTAKLSRAGHTTELLTNQLHYQLLAMSNYQAKQATTEPQSVDEEVKGLRGIEGARKRAAAGKKNQPNLNEPEKKEALKQVLVEQPLDRYHNDLASFEHPIFALRAGDKKVRVYEHNGVEITVTPPATGAAHMLDKDLWIYCVSQVISAAERGATVGRSVCFSVHDFLKSTGRAQNAQNYARIDLMLNRLAGTRISTNLETGGKRIREGFGLVESWKVVEDPERKLVEVLMPVWLYRAAINRQILTIDPEYFALKSPLERRVYEIARKHCGQQGTWKVSVELMQKKCGSQSAKKEFLRLLKDIEKRQSLPRYKMRI